MNLFIRQTITPLCSVCILWSPDERSGAEVLSISLSTGVTSPLPPHPDCAEMTERRHRDIEELVRNIRIMLAGGVPFFDTDLLRLTPGDDLRSAVLRETLRIPRGEVSTYGRIAELAGNPSAARAVGSVLSSNPFPLVIPCHRVIRSDGGLGGFGPGVELKRELLRMEGVSKQPLIKS